MNVWIWVGIISAAVIILIITAAVVIYFSNKRIDLTCYDVYDKRLPEGFDGAKIVQVSDLHNNVFGKRNEQLIKKIKQIKPDYIFITGDFLDARKTKFSVCEQLAENLSSIAPTYYCTGNHEVRIMHFLEKLEKKFRSYGITNLRNKSVWLRRKGSMIRLSGADDPSFFKGVYEREDKEQILSGILDSLVCRESYNILLSHKPGFYNCYENAGFELVFSGHAHGGQFRLPGNIPLYVPDMGMFPKYVQGVSRINNTILVVSRGLGQSIIPFRINNSPELVAVTLHSSEAPAIK